MKAVAYAIIAIGALVVYEAYEGLKGTGSAANAQAAGTQSTGSSNGGGGTATGTVDSSGSTIPGGWLDALAAHESPSALNNGDFTYGAFGLSAGSTPGIGTPGSICYASQDPNGGCFTPQLYSGWSQAVQGLEQWINRYAPEAYQATSCAQFVSILQQHGYGNLAGTC